MDLGKIRQVGIACRSHYFLGAALATGCLLSACQFGSPRGGSMAASVQAQSSQAPQSAFDTLSARVKTGESFNSIVRGLSLPPELPFQALRRAGL